MMITKYSNFIMIDIFSLLVSVKAFAWLLFLLNSHAKRKNIKLAANKYSFSFVCHASVKEFVDLSVRSIVK